MAGDERMDRLEKMVADIHRSVVIIENDHGRKIDLLVEGLAGTNARLDRVEHRLDGVENRLDGVENRLDRVEHRLANIEGDVHEIKGVLGLLKAIGNDHEHRIQALEHALRAQP